MPQIVNLCDGLRGAAAMLCRAVDMQDDPFPQALSQLAAAVDRLEAVAQTPAPDARLALLQARHDRLREAAAAALARLDRLIDDAAAATEGE
jgi:hypothetical protein